MAATARARRFGTFAALALAAATFGAVLAPPANAGSEPYLGWDFGRGLGIGIGTPPSAYDRCPTYGWPVYPYRCRYYRPVHHHRFYRHHRYRHHYR
jgi:hypothetical protein